ncbi:MAG: hypothetical protein ABDH66_07950 [Bacteroidia bacterium]
MSVEAILTRLTLYEYRRSLRWTVMIGLLWIGLWIASFLLLPSPPSEEPLSEAELLVHEAYFYPIDL